MNTTSNADDKVNWLDSVERAEKWERKLMSVPMDWRAPIIDVLDTIGLLKQGLMVHGIDDAIVLIEAARMTLERYDNYKAESDFELEELEEGQ